MTDPCERRETSSFKSSARPTKDRAHARWAFCFYRRCNRCAIYRYKAMELTIECSKKIKGNKRTVVWRTGTESYRVSSVLT